MTTEPGTAARRRGARTGGLVLVTFSCVCNFYSVQYLAANKSRSYQSRGHAKSRRAVTRGRGICASVTALLRHMAPTATALASAMPPAANTATPKKRKKAKKKKVATSSPSPKVQTGEAGPDDPPATEVEEDGDEEEYDETEEFITSLDPADLEAEGEFRARTAMREGRYDEAEGLYRSVLASRCDTLGPGHEVTVATKQGLGVLLHWKGDLLGAEVLLREVMDARRTTLGEKHQSTIGVKSHLGLLLKDMGEFGGSEALLREASTVTTELYGPGHADALIMKGNLGGLLKEARDASAETVLREALNGMRKVLGEAHTATLTCSINLALVLVGKGSSESMDAAEGMLRESAKASRESAGESHPLHHATLTHLASLLETKNDLEGALSIHRQVLDSSPKGQDTTKKVASHVAALLQRLGRGAEADSLLTSYQVYK